MDFHICCKGIFILKVLEGGDECASRALPCQVCGHPVSGVPCACPVSRPCCPGPSLLLFFPEQRCVCRGCAICHEEDVPLGKPALNRLLLALSLRLVCGWRPACCLWVFMCVTELRSFIIFSEEGFATARLLKPNHAV